MSDDHAGTAAGHAWSIGSGIGALVLFIALSGFWDCTDSAGVTERVYSLPGPPTVIPVLGQSPPTCTMAYFSFISSPVAAYALGLLAAGVAYLIVDIATAPRRKAARGGGATV